MFSKRCFLQYLLTFFCLNVCSVNNLKILNNNYCRQPDGQCKSQVILYVNRLTSEKNLLPYEYHDFDFCPIDEAHSSIKNLGQMVFGDRIHPSAYKIYFMEDVTCAQLCTRSYPKHNEISAKRLDALRKGIQSNYRHHWTVDNMQVTWCYHMNNNKKSCTIGFPIGMTSESDPYDMNAMYNKPDHYYAFNHVDLTITYTNESENWGIGADVGRIVSIEVQPTSIQHHSNKLDCTSNEPLAIPSTTENISINITYSYSVKFVLDNSVKWSSRWDYLFQSMSYSSTQIHWYSLQNSAVIIAFLSAMIARVFKKINKTNQQSRTSCQLSDVYRSPCNGMLLSIFVGSGIQVFCSAMVTLALASLGLLSPPNRGELMTRAMLLYSLFSLAAGYVSARVYKCFGGDRWKVLIFLTATLCTGLVLGLFCILNLILWIFHERSSGAVSINALIILLLLWICVSMPLTLIGTHFGRNQTPLVQILNNKQIQHLIPTPRIHCRSIISILCGGIIQFGCIFIQLFYILNSIWFDQIYYMFGFLFLIFCILIIICSETVVLLCYFHLCAKDYQWQWRSFFTSGCTAFYLFVYCCYYFVFKLSIEDAASVVLYFGYTLMISFLFFLMVGTIGFLACFWFIQRIYRVQ